VYTAPTDALGLVSRLDYPHVVHSVDVKLRPQVAHRLQHLTIVGHLAGVCIHRRRVATASKATEWGRTRTQTFNGPFSGTTRYQKGKTNLDFTEARGSEWQWHQLGRMQVCTLLQTDNYTSTPPLSFLQAACPSCRPTNSVKALKAIALKARVGKKNTQKRRITFRNVGKNKKCFET